MKVLVLIAVLTVVLGATAARAELAACRPTANCGDANMPCRNLITEGQVEKLRPNPVAGDPVVRVRLCLGGYPGCDLSDDKIVQAATVWGYAGQKQIFEETLTAAKPDTGPYTKLPGLTELRVRCNTASPGSHCRVMWQVCRETLPVKNAQ